MASPEEDSAKNPGKPLITVIDDEQDILELISVHLQKGGFQEKMFAAARPFLAYIQTAKPDLIVLDLMLPDVDGLEVCKSLKADPRTAAIPILMLTAKGDETDVVLGLELGADDYMVKPFSPKELIARIKAILRRHKQGHDEDARRVTVQDRLVIDVNRHEVFVDGKKVTLTKTEFTILQVLSSRIGWVFSREKLMTRLWGDEKFIIDRTIDVHIKNLRDKLGALGEWIKNVRGVGYKLEP